MHVGKRAPRIHLTVPMLRWSAHIRGIRIDEGGSGCSGALLKDDLEHTLFNISRLPRLLVFNEQPKLNPFKLSKVDTIQQLQHKGIIPMFNTLENQILLADGSVIDQMITPCQIITHALRQQSFRFHKAIGFPLPICIIQFVIQAEW